MTVQNKNQLGSVLIAKLDNLLMRIDLIDQKLDGLLSENDQEHFLSLAVDEPPTQPVKQKRNTRKTYERKIKPINEHGLHKDSIRQYDDAERDIINDPKSFLSVVLLYNDGVKKSDIPERMENKKPYHSYGSTLKMLRVAVSRGYVISHSYSLSITDKLEKLLKP